MLMCLVFSQIAAWKVISNIKSEVGGREEDKEKDCNVK